MLTILVDHNIEGQAMLLVGTLSTEGWLDLVPLRMMTFAQAGLPSDSSDREVWQSHRNIGDVYLSESP